MCDCEPNAPLERDEIADGLEPFLFLRTCDGCGRQWQSGHCPHDGYQRRCPECGWLPPGTVSFAEQFTAATTP